MTQRSFTFLLIVPLLAFLAACGGNSVVAAPDGIAGTLTAPAGSDISGTIVGACVGESCITATADASGNYSITGLTPGQYQIIAWKDVNQSQQIDAGDYVGFYTQDGQTPAPVSPPASGINITLVVG